MVEFIFDIDSSEGPKIRSVSSSVEELLGYTCLEIIECKLFLQDRIHPHDSDIAGKLFSHNLQEGLGSFNIRLRHADGRIRCARGRSQKKAKRNGDVHLQLKLQDSRSLWKGPLRQRIPPNFRAMLQNTDDFIFFKDRNHVFTAVSRNMTAGPDQAVQGPSLLGQTDYEIFPEEYADIYYRLEKQVFAGATVASEIHESQTVDGRLAWLDNHKYPIKNDRGEIVGLFGVVRDITERIKAEQLLRESEESLLEAQKIARLGSLVLDLKTGIWACTAMLDELLGIDESFEHSIAEWKQINHPDDRDQIDARIREAVIGEGKLFDAEHRIIRQNDGAVRWMHGRGRVELDAQGQPTILRGTVQDITEQKQSEVALRESKELLQLFLHNAPAALAMLDREQRYLAVSDRWMQNFGPADGPIIGRFHSEVLPWIPDRWRDDDRRAMKGEIIPTCEDCLQREDGGFQWLLKEVCPWFSGDGAIGGIIIFMEDITRQRQATERLTLAASVFSEASEGILITDSSGSILEVNEAFTRISGYIREEVLGRNPSILKSRRQGREFYAEMWRELTQNGRWAGEIWNRAKNGRIYAENLTIRALRDSSGKTEKYVAVFSDITQIKEHEKQLEQLANYDFLTGLPNRTLLGHLLNRYLDHARLRGRQIAVVHFNIDDFKAITDRNGRDIANKLLIAFAHRLKNALRGTDSLARIASDDFVSICPDTTEFGGCLHVLAKILKSVSEPVRLGDLVLQVSACAGVTFFPQAEEVDADQLLRQASQALFEAKQEGRSRYRIFDPDLDRSARNRNEALENIRGALEANEFVLYYQPKVNMRTGEVLGAEALIRWSHPEQGLLPPHAFLPVIEGHSLALEVGNWVIESALVQMELWREVGLEIPVSVNIGAEQLQQADFVDNLSALLKAHPTVPPSSIEIEVLESSAIQDVARASTAIHGCKRLGISFAIDDFGTGYATLAYLKSLPVDVLKIDQTFVREMLIESGNLAIVEGMLGLATAFQCRIVAEGVETLEQGLMLLLLGCPVAQGNAIARPMPALDLPGWVSAWRPDSQWKDVVPFDAGNRPVLYAIVEHHAWILAIDEFLRGRRQNVPALDPNQCRFGAWLRGEALVFGQVLQGRGGLLGFRSIDLLHERIHALAAEILSMNGNGQEAEAISRLPELHTLGNDLFEKLNNLTYQGDSGTTSRTRMRRAK